jgi:hypothetical protein
MSGVEKSDGTKTVVGTASALEKSWGSRSGRWPVDQEQRLGIGIGGVGSKTQPTAQPKIYDLGGSRL